ncbi:HypC/HybG/HupF family hydrogenase formation chaperone [Metallumcola ferriviriculae]|uniref:HypC/HybG/HupF family hydrogenase formation chaperone n=1 Tax=Metallumcola ferriviriculae TaxID=3039180 RepID=A0AAU0URD7_9FIRM|nr:HypC/HybG/HupF family hydrogenase formation chaperone [Desulfitibacteraceae bacterium MK1]
MCLAVPLRIKTRSGDMAEAGDETLRRKISLALTPDAAEGDWVLVHAGYAIHQISEEDALETLKLLEELGESNG